MHYGLGQEWMQMVVVDDFAAFDDAEGRADLRIDPPAGLCCLDGNRVCAVTAGKSISLCRYNADVAVVSDSRDRTHFFRPSSGKEGQQDGKYEHK